MRSEEPQSLWSFGETEPWRRGRMALVILGALAFATHFLVLGIFALAGDVQLLLAQAFAALLFWLQFYFIWIGVEWVRWVQGFLSGLWGFALIIWGLRDKSAIQVGLGLYWFGFGAYIGLAPSIYFFAKRQQERRRGIEPLIAAGIFAILLVSLGIGIVGLTTYRVQREAEVQRFADTALRRIFAQHDTYFFLDHTSETLRRENSHLELTRFLQGATIRAGDVQDIQPAVGQWQFRYRFPLKLTGFGILRAQGKGSAGRVEMQLKLVEEENDLKIDQVRWFYLDLEKSEQH